MKQMRSKTSAYAPGSCYYGSSNSYFSSSPIGSLGAMNLSDVKAILDLIPGKYLPDAQWLSIRPLP